MQSTPVLYFYFQSFGPRFVFTVHLIIVVFGDHGERKQSGAGDIYWLGKERNYRKTMNAIQFYGDATSYYNQ